MAAFGAFDEINKEEKKEEFTKQRRTRNSYAIFFWFSSMLKFQIIGVH